MELTSRPTLGFRGVSEGLCAKVVKARLSEHVAVWASSMGLKLLPRVLSRTELLSVSTCGHFSNFGKLSLNKESYSLIGSRSKT